MWGDTLLVGQGAAPGDPAGTFEIVGIRTDDGTARWSAVVEDLDVRTDDVTPFVAANETVYFGTGRGEVRAVAAV